MEEKLKLRYQRSHLTARQLSAVINTSLAGRHTNYANFAIIATVTETHRNTTQIQPQSQDSAAIAAPAVAVAVYSDLRTLSTTQQAAAFGSGSIIRVDAGLTGGVVVLAGTTYVSGGLFIHDVGVPMGRVSVLQTSGSSDFTLLNGFDVVLRAPPSAPTGAGAGAGAGTVGTLTIQVVDSNGTEQQKTYTIYWMSPASIASFVQPYARIVMHAVTRAVADSDSDTDSDSGSSSDVDVDVGESDPLKLYTYAFPIEYNNCPCNKLLN